MTKKDRREFDAVLTDATTLERPVADQPYHSFNKFRIDDGKIKLSRDVKRGVLINPSKGMLEDFVALADADEHKYLEYACRWGLLDLCKEHYAPTSHNNNCEPIVPSRTHVFVTTAKAAEEHRETLLSEGEPISAWRDYARFARALLNIAARLHQEEIGTDEDWRTLHFDESGFLGIDYSAKRREGTTFPDLDREKSLLASGVNFWLGKRGSPASGFLEYIQARCYVRVYQTLRKALRESGNSTDDGSKPGCFGCNMLGLRTIVYA
jgi:hypothetical protein